MGKITPVLYSLWNNKHTSTRHDFLSEGCTHIIFQVYKWSGFFRAIQLCGLLQRLQHFLQLKTLVWSLDLGTWGPVLWARWGWQCEQRLWKYWSTVSGFHLQVPSGGVLNWNCRNFTLVFCIPHSLNTQRYIHMLLIEEVVLLFIAILVCEWRALSYKEANIEL